MRHFALGLVLGSLFAGTLVSAGTFYDSAGKPAVPRGSVQQFDYFRQRQLFLDAAAIRQQADNHHLNQLTKPCAK
jgi:hypothetical protein